MKKSFTLFTSLMLLMGVLSLPVTSLSAAQLNIDSSSLIAKDAQLQHKWFLRFDLARPQTSGGAHLFSGHVQFALIDPQGELVFHRTYSLETLPTQASISAGGLPKIQTFKISKPIKGQYTLLVTLLDKKSDSGVFDSTTGSASNYIFNAQLFVFNEHNKILLKSTDASATPFIPNVNQITMPTDPKVTAEQTFSLQLS